jgi:IS30 family transposase
MKHYTHLSASEREEVSRGLAQGKSIRLIAKDLHRNPREHLKNTTFKSSLV